VASAPVFVFIAVVDGEVVVADIDWLIAMLLVI
jgi:hypothetical protein